MAELPDWIESLRLDRTGGAAEIAIRAAHGFEGLARQPGFSEAVRTEVARALARAQPAMAPLVHLANRVLSAPLGEAAAVCHSFGESLQRATEVIGSLVAGRIEDGMPVMTHSYSSTVLEALLATKRAGRRFQVICTEARPMREGVTLARKLAAEGIPVKLIVDAAACSFVPQVRLVLVGADAISAQGLLNKTGTAALALAAKGLGIDIYSLTSTAKLVPAGYQAPDQELRPPAEILEEPPPNVVPVNYYFDLTPLEHLSGVITEVGILPSEMLLRLLGTIRVHPALAG